LWFASFTNWPNGHIGFCALNKWKHTECILLCVWVFFGGTGVWTQGFMFRCSKLEPHIQSILLWLFWRWGFRNYLPGLASSLDPPDLSLLSSYDYRREPPGPGFFFPFCWDRVMQCSLCGTQTLWPPTSASWVLGLQLCATMSSSSFVFLLSHCVKRSCLL
jgi:hypothetical protein